MSASTFLAPLMLVLSVLPFSFEWEMAPREVQPEDPIRVVDRWVTNEFPDALTFGLEVESEEALARAELVYWVQGDASRTRQPVEFEVGEVTRLTYTWETANITVAPSSHVTYFWDLADGAGRRLTTGESSFYYDDVRFAWNELRREDLIVRWYEGDQTFGEEIFEAAQTALNQMQAATEQTLEFPIHVLLYANPEDFAEWHSYVDTWVAGEAFSALGVTAQIVPSNAGKGWIWSIIPHEIAHLFFYQVVYTPYGSWPSWLDEGLAQYYELVDQGSGLELAAQAAREGRLLPLRALSGGFGRDPDQVHLAYAQSLSVVTFLLETWGETGLQKLIQAFRSGSNPQNAVEQALGVRWEVFEARWITWMGVPATPRPPATPTATLALPTRHPGWPTITPRAPGGSADERKPPPENRLAAENEPYLWFVGAAGLMFGLGVSMYALRRRRRGV